MAIKILACVDGSDASVGVCHWAGWLGQNANTPANISVLHVIEKNRTTEKNDTSGTLTLGAREHLLDALSEQDAVRAKQLKANGKIVVQQARELISTYSVGEIDTIFEHNDIIDSVRTHMGTHHLLVLGQHGTQHMDGRTGAHVLSLMDMVQSPILISKGTWQIPRNVLIAYDGTKGADKVIDFVVHHVQFGQMTCHLLMAGGQPKLLDEPLRRLREAGISAQAHCELSENIQELIARYETENAIDLLVMGTHGHSKWRRLVKGSTALHLLKASTRSILIIK